MSTERYDDVRASCLDGDLVAFGGSWALSRAIQWWTDSDVSHLGVLLWIDAGEASPRLCVMESVGGGVRLFPFSALNRGYHKAGGRLWTARYEGPESRATIRARALTAWGSNYPDEGRLLPRQYLSAMFRWARWLWGSDVDPEAYTCSEFAAHCYGLPDAALKTPRQVIEWQYPHAELGPMFASYSMFGPLVEIEEQTGPWQPQQIK